MSYKARDSMPIYPEIVLQNYSREGSNSLQFDSNSVRNKLAKEAADIDSFILGHQTGNGEKRHDCFCLSSYDATEDVRKAILVVREEISKRNGKGENSIASYIKEKIKGKTLL